jgi:hypothetical protein
MKIAILAVALFVSTQVTADQTQPVSPLKLISAQANPNFTFIRTHKQGTGQTVQWSMSSNANIERFEVQSTYEDPTDIYSNWYTIGQVNNSNSNVLKFTDQGALPGIINYRVVAIMRNNAGTVCSGFCTTVID